MSNWTHVAGVIRVDDFRFDEKSLDFESLIGKEVNYGDPYDVWKDAEEHPEKYLPMGREGSLQMSVWVNPDKDCAAAYTVTIFGDLRDHDSPQEIVDWFKDICNKLYVRNAMIVADNEINGQISWIYKEE